MVDYCHCERAEKIWAPEKDKRKFRVKQNLPYAVCGEGEEEDNVREAGKWHKHRENNHKPRKNLKKSLDLDRTLLDEWHRIVRKSRKEPNNAGNRRNELENPDKQAKRVPHSGED